MIALFREVAVGERFEFYGVQYRRAALSMPQDEKELGNIFRDETVVTVADGVPLFQGPRQPEPYWADRLTPAPGQRDRWEGVTNIADAANGRVLGHPGPCLVVEGRKSGSTRLPTVPDLNATVFCQAT
jgi:hypothetical protein